MDGGGGGGTDATDVITKRKMHKKSQRFSLSPPGALAIWNQTQSRQIPMLIRSIFIGLAQPSLWGVTSCGASQSGNTQWWALSGEHLHAFICSPGLLSGPLNAAPWGCSASLGVFFSNGGSMDPLNRALTPPTIRRPVTADPGIGQVLYQVRGCGWWRCRGSHLLLF